ncbi:MAG: hypothetical protein ACTSVI_00820 [Promethearchaeota archaeon]
MANVDEKTTEKTVRKEIIDILMNLKEPLSVDRLIESIKEMRKENIIDDINHALKTLKAKGQKFKIYPATCRKCNFIFKAPKLEIKIPHRCPQCKSELINSPIIQKK